MLPNSGKKIRIANTVVLLAFFGISAYVLSLNRATMEDYLAVGFVAMLLSLSIWLGMIAGLVFSILSILAYGGYFFFLIVVKQMRADIGLHEMVWFLLIPAIAVMGGYLGDAVGFVDKLFIRYRRQLYTLVMTGQLGMVGDKASLDQGLQEECSRARRSLSTFSVVLLDVKNMDQIQTLLGADALVQVSQKISEAISRNTRDIDRKARLEGAQHAILVTDANLEHTHGMLDHIFKSLLRTEVEYRGRFMKVEIQLLRGIARFPEDSDTPQGLLKIAQANLRVAQNQLESAHP